MSESGLLHVLSRAEFSVKTTTHSKVSIDLTTLAAAFSRGDGDGHRWDEEDVRQWLRRMGFNASGNAAIFDSDHVPWSASMTRNMFSSGGFSAVVGSR